MEIKSYKGKKTIGVRPEPGCKASSTCDIAKFECCMDFSIHRAMQQTIYFQVYALSPLLSIKKISDTTFLIEQSMHVVKDRGESQI